MTTKRGKARHITPAERGLVVQRVLVEGWSVAEAAAASRHPETRVERWVAAYRRRGMASLRNDAIDRAPSRWLWLLRLVSAGLATAPGARHGGDVAPASDGRDRHSGRS
jgi:hypothetical protein